MAYQLLVLYVEPQLRGIAVRNFTGTRTAEFYVVYWCVECHMVGVAESWPTKP